VLFPTVVFSKNWHSPSTGLQSGLYVTVYVEGSTW